MREQCGLHGEFKKQADGCLTWEDYRALRYIIARQAGRVLKPMKDEIDKKRKEAFKAGNDGEYFKCFREGQFARTNATNTMTNKTLTYIELDPMVYRRSMVAHTKDKKKQLELHLVESSAVRDLETLKDIEKDKCISVFKEKTKRELEQWRRVESMRFTTGQAQLREMVEIENLRTSDFLEQEYGFSMSDLMRNVHKQKIHELPEIKSFQKMFDMQKETEMKARAAKAAIPEDIVKELLADAKELGAAQVKGDGMMTFDYFLSVSKVILKYKERMCADKLEASVAERRELLKAEKFEEFNKMAIELSNWETQVTNNIEAKLYTTLKVNK